MTKRKDLKHLVRERMVKTGESYMAARRQLLTNTSPIAGPAAVEPWDPRFETPVFEVRSILERALRIEKRLTVDGIGLHNESQRRRDARVAKLASRGAAEINAEIEAEVEAEIEAEIGAEIDLSRVDLANRLHEIAACADWIRRQRTLKSFNRRHTSYGYKHYVERWFDVRGAHVYVSNGSFIAAAIGLGFEGKPEGLNLLFRFSERTLDTPL